MASSLFGRLAPSRGTRSFYDELRSHGRDDLEQGEALNVDEENFRQQLSGLDAGALAAGDSCLSVDSTARGGNYLDEATRQHRTPRDEPTHDDDIDSDVPASLLVEPNDVDLLQTSGHVLGSRPVQSQVQRGSANSEGRSQLQWDEVTAQQRLHRDESAVPHPQYLMTRTFTGGRREKSLWRWANTSNLDSFMRDVYHYYEGGGLPCILCSNALWLMSV